MSDKNSSFWPRKPITVPRLTTDRLFLRPPIPEDAPSIFRILQNWNVVRLTASIPYPYHDIAIAKDWIAASAERAETGEAAVFAICASDPTGDQTGDRFIGSVELKIDASANSSGAEVGYYLDEIWWGGGYTTEAVRAILAIGFDDLGLSAIIGMTRLDNQRSSRVLEKLGFAHDGFETRFAPERSRHDKLNRFILTEKRWRQEQKPAQGGMRHG